MSGPRDIIAIGLARLAMGRRSTDGPIAPERDRVGEGLAFADDIDPRDAYDVRCVACDFIITATEILAFRFPMACPRCCNRRRWEALSTRDGVPRARRATSARPRR